jgi:hypothetical protein
MILRRQQGRRAPICAASALLMALAGNGAFAQAPPGGRGGPPPAPLTPKAMAPEDVSGYWVSVVTEDWRFRMVTPAKGDYASVPINGAGRAMANNWDPDKDIAAGEQCKSYGAAGLMRVPGRIHITWPDESTIKLEMDAGQQTRIFHFNGTAPAEEKPSLQGYSVATWDGPPAGRGGGRGPMRAGALKVVTTHLLPGYLRKNGVPYSDKTVLTEYYTRTNESNGDSWLIITTIVDDPTYLTGNFITSTNFKMEPNGSKWMPSPCEAK